MAPFQKCAYFGVFLAACLGFVSAAPTEFDEELAFLNNLNVDELTDTESNEVFSSRANLLASTAYLLARYGYPSETHIIITEDYYFLTLHRIPNPGRPAVFLQHGILSSSADWVVLGPKKALALMLYDAGYDVWMGNSRGNTYSRAHATMSPSEAKFWDFTWHEMGVHDLPTSIDFVLQKTSQKDLVYMAHSQGTTAFFVMMSERPEYNKKVRAMFAMAPVAYFNKVRSFPLRVLSLVKSQLGLIAKMIGMHEFLPSTNFIRKMATVVCSDESLTQPICANVLFLICGFDSDQLNKTMLPEILQNIPAGASTKQVMHFAQLMTREPIFRQYDYGWIQNLWHYGSRNPPSYDLSKVTTQVHLFFGENDLIAVPESVSLLHKTLPNLVEYLRVPHDRWNHMDFLFGKDANVLIYSRIINSVNQIYPPKNFWEWIWPWNVLKNRQILWGGSRR